MSSLEATLLAAEAFHGVRFMRKNVMILTT